MAHRAVISVMGLYRWNEEIFDDFSIPSALSKEVLTGLILAQCAEMEVCIPDPKVFREVVKFWSASRVKSWTLMYDALTSDYNPIWNKDGKITEDIKTDSEGTGSVAGFNSDTLNPANKNEGKETQHYERVEQGNIGETTTQQMITEEIQLRQKFSIYKIIVDEFKYQFCLSVY